MHGWRDKQDVEVQGGDKPIKHEHKVDTTQMNEQQLDELIQARLNQREGDGT